MVELFRTLICLIVAGNVISTGVMCILYDMWCYQEYNLEINIKSIEQIDNNHGLLMFGTASLMLDCLLLVLRSYPY